MFLLKYSNHFKKDFKRYRYDEKVIKELGRVLDLLVEKGELPSKYQCHELHGEFVKCFECHLRPDVLLVYKVEKIEITILLLRIGSHSKLF
jgi:mRNA interferase YafQ